MVYIFYLGTALLSFGNGVIVFIVNPKRTINRIFCGASVWIGVWFLCVFMAIQEGANYIGGPADAVLFWLRASSSVAAFLIWIISLMRSALISSHRSLASLLTATALWFVISLCLALLPFSESYIPSSSTPLASQRGIGYFTFMGAIALFCAGLLVDALRSSSRLTGVRRLEMRFFVLNATCACLLMIVLNVIGLIIKLPWLRHVGPLGFVALHMLTVWALCSHRVFDAKQVMCTIGQRAAFLCILGFGAGVFFAALEGFTDRPLDILFAALLTGILAIFLEQPTRRWFGLDPDRQLASPRRAIIACARNESDVEELRRQFEQILCDWCRTERVGLYFEKERRFIGGSSAPSFQLPVFPVLLKNGWITPEFIQRRRPDSETDVAAKWMSDHHCGALIAVPRGSDHPSLVVTLGQRRSLRPFTYPDIQLLFSLAELLDNILTHAILAQHSAKLERLESAAMMSRSLAHDLSNLTTPIAAYLLCAEGRDKNGSSEAEVYEAARHSIGVMGSYIRETMFFSRRLTPEFSDVTAEDAVNSVVRISQERAKARNIKLITSCEEGARFVADRALFERMILNLVNNAIDASPDHGTINIFACKKEEQLVLRVEDRGGGIPSENIRRIFEPYFTTKDTGDTRRGLGLGLAICRKIATLHNGDINVSSCVGKGTAFTATFPLVQENFQQEHSNIMDSPTKKASPSASEFLRTTLNVATNPS